MENFRLDGPILAEFRLFFCIFGLFGGPGTCVFFGDPKTAKNPPKNRIRGPVEAVSGKFSGDVIVAHGDSATDEPKKYGFRAVEPELCPKYRFACAPAVGLMPSNPRT